MWRVDGVEGGDTAGGDSGGDEAVRSGHGGGHNCAGDSTPQLCIRRATLLLVKRCCASDTREWSEGDVPA